MCGSRTWCRALMAALLVAVGACLDQLDRPPASEDAIYQDGIGVEDIDTGPGEEVLSVPRRDVLLKKIFQALELQAASGDRISYRPIKIPYEANEDRVEQRLPEGTYEESFIRTPYKRLSSLWGGQLQKFEMWPQQKWKIKKGHAPTYGLCYFKLCAFRPGS